MLYNVLKYYTFIDSSRCLGLDLSVVTKQTALHLRIACDSNPET